LHGIITEIIAETQNFVFHGFLSISFETDEKS